jgi:hypothetical protein
MQNPDLRMQHIIILTALFVSLLGTLVILDTMNNNAIPITGATATNGVSPPQPAEEDNLVRIVEVEIEEEDPTT